MCAWRQISWRSSKYSNQLCLEAEEDKDANHQIFSEKRKEEQPEDLAILPGQMTPLPLVDVMCGAGLSIALLLGLFLVICMQMNLPWDLLGH